jgi:hypothetical protein
MIRSFESGITPADCASGRENYYKMKVDRAIRCGRFSSWLGTASRMSTSKSETIEIVGSDAEDRFLDDLARVIVLVAEELAKEEISVKMEGNDSK